MIIQESRIKTISGARAITKHVLHGQKNEAIRIMAGSEWLLQNAMQEAERENLTYGLRHIAFNPADPMTDDQLAEFAGRICHEFHADPDHMTLVIHQKNGSTHGHLLLPEWQHDHILDSRFSWIRLEKLARLEEIRLGHALVAGRHDRSIAKALRKEGKHQEAELIDALVPEQPADKPRAAYTSQSHRIAERQGLDLPKLKQLIVSLWGQSDGLKAFREALKAHDLNMREGDRKKTRPGAHIIETSDGTLIGSFARLTKVRMVDFRTLLAEEQQQTAKKPETDIKTTRLPFRRTTVNFHDEFLIPKVSDVYLVTPQRPVIKRPKMKDWQRQLWLQRIAHVDIPSTNRLLPESPVHIISIEKLHSRQKIKKDIAEQQAILDQQAPEVSWKPLDKEETLTKWRRQLVPYQKQLKNSFDRYNSAKQERQDAEKSRWHRMTGKAQRLEKIADTLLFEFLEVLRFVVEILLHLVGLRSELPSPIRTILNEKDQTALERFKETHDAEFSAMADRAKLDGWLSSCFDRLVDVRTKRIRQWNTAHQPEKDHARQEIERLSTLLITIPASQTRQLSCDQYIPRASVPSPSIG